MSTIHKFKKKQHNNTVETTCTSIMVQDLPKELATLLSYSEHFFLFLPCMYMPLNNLYLFVSFNIISLISLHIFFNFFVCSTLFVSFIHIDTCNLIIFHFCMAFHGVKIIYFSNGLPLQYYEHSCIQLLGCTCFSRVQIYDWNCCLIGFLHFTKYQIIYKVFVPVYTLISGAFGSQLLHITIEKFSNRCEKVLTCRPLLLCFHSCFLVCGLLIYPFFLFKNYVIIF